MTDEAKDKLDGDPDTMTNEEIEKRNNTIADIISSSIYANTEGGQIECNTGLNVYEVEAIGEILHVYVKSTQESIRKFLEDRGYSDITEVPEDEFPSGMLRTLTLVAGATTASNKMNKLHKELDEKIKNQKEEKKDES